MLRLGGGVIGVVVTIVSAVEFGCPNPVTNVPALSAWSVTDPTAAAELVAAAAGGGDGAAEFAAGRLLGLGCEGVGAVDCGCEGVALGGKTVVVRVVETTELERREKKKRNV